MEEFIGKDFMLQSDAARELYHESAENMPIIDYHCHLIPQMIADNYKFRDLTEIWLGGDHYKWRAMRGNGVPEEYITGDRTPYEKFEKWAATVPYTMRNPLYHWTHLELARAFDVHKILKPETAREI
jgi:glucuronate isomerase